MSMVTHNWMKEANEQKKIPSKPRKVKKAKNVD